MKLNSEISPVNNIIRFFLILIIEIVIIALSLFLIFSLNIQQIVSDKVPEYIKNIYLSLLYIAIISNLYFSDKKNFIGVFKLNMNRINFFIKGFLFGFISLFLLYYFELSFGFISLKSNEIKSLLLVQCIVTSLLIGISEELLFRNFIFRKLAEIYSFKKSIIISSYIYAQLHFLRFNLTFLQILLPLTGLFFVGCILAYCFNKKSIWYSIGIHSAWVFLISYTNQDNSFFIEEKFILLTGANYPIAGLSGIIMSITLLIFFTKENKGKLIK